MQTHILLAPIELTKKVFTRLVKREVGQLSHENVKVEWHSLEVDRRDHMGPVGCLDQPQSMLATHISEAMQRVPPIVTISVIRRLCETL